MYFHAIALLSLLHAASVSAAACSRLPRPDKAVTTERPHALALEVAVPIESTATVPVAANRETPPPSHADGPPAPVVSPRLAEAHSTASGRTEPSPAALAKEAAPPQGKTVSAASGSSSAATGPAGSGTFMPGEDGTLCLAADSGNDSMAGSGGPFSGGDTTIYGDLGFGACGEVTTPADGWYAAMSYCNFARLPGAESLNPNKSPLCGRKAKVSVPGKEAKEVTIVDKCGGCKNANDLDLSPAAFAYFYDGATTGRFKDMTFTWV